MAGYKPTHTMASETGDNRLLARSARGYPWNWYGDNEPAIFGNDDDATIVWNGTSLVIAGAAGFGDGFKVTSTTATTGALAVTAAGNLDTLISTQPAGTIIKDIILTTSSSIVTAGASGDDLDISLGTSSGGNQLLAVTALLDDGGAPVTWTANAPLWLFQNSADIGAQAFVAAATPRGVIGGPATTEAITAAATLYASTARSIYMRLTPLANDLTTAGGTVTAVVTYMYI